MSDGDDSLSTNQVQAAVLEVCGLDVEALKPGNVSVGLPAHGMTADHFQRSAIAVAPILANPALGVGQRILTAVQATVESVACNTNLGIVLLSAPLCQAVLHPGTGSLRARLSRVLAHLDMDDARLTFKAIRLAEPAGLGEVTKHDVYSEPDVSLLVAMQAASARDSIARQYSTDYNDVFAVGIPALREHQVSDANLGRATTACFLQLATTFRDTHIERKHGKACAEQVREQMRAVEKAWKACENPSSARSLLRRYDNKFKRSGINPGTSADLTVASLLGMRFDSHLSGTSASE